MLRTAPYFTTAPLYGLLPNLFDSSVKSALERGAGVAAALGYVSQDLNSLSGSAVDGPQFISLLQSFAANPPTFTVYQLAGPNGATMRFVSPFAPLFNFAV